MKVVILAGGFGTRITEESATKPKPMVEIGGRPILWHIMKIYSHYGLNDFVICLGYKGYVIKKFFADYFLSMSDVRFDLETNTVEYLNNAAEPWKVALVDTGEKTLTGGRLRRVKDYLGDETFCMTYGDGVTNLNIPKVIEFHREHKGLATLSAMQPPGRYGAFTLHKDQKRIERFAEKPKGDGAWVSGGFFVLEPKVIDYIGGDLITWEQEPMQNLARDGNLFVFPHDGFWHAMDSLRDKMVLEEMWAAGKAPWKIWDDETIG
jgi:glucose-1-phosphate cytidylyltransferase